MLLRFQLRRIISNRTGTISVLRAHNVLNGDRFESFMVEDPFQLTKIPGNTRIPPGDYPLTKCTDSPMARRYKERYDMPWIPAIEDVPGFDYIRMHVGNWPSNTEGCPLFNKFVTLDTAMSRTTWNGGTVGGQQSLVAMRSFMRFVETCKPNAMKISVRDAD